MSEPVTAPAFVDRCVFIDGQEVYRGPECVHGREHDELGEVKPQGWTVQQ